MDQHTVKLLEFQVILDELKDKCFSPEGEYTLQKQEILTEAPEVSRLLSLSVSFRRLLESGRNMPALDFPQWEGRKAEQWKEGLLLEAVELTTIGRTLISARKLKRYLVQGAGTEELSRIARGIADLDFLPRAIFRLLDKDANIREKNVPELKSIRARIRTLQREVSRLAGSYLNNSDFKFYWQADVPTQKEGRIVLPMKANFKGRIKGVVHEMSASGATLYLEPLDIMERNNELVQKENEYRREVIRLLKNLSARIIEYTAEIRQTLAGVGLLDSICARARYAIQHRCTMAENREGGVDLRLARHPLLGTKAVPISLRLTPGERILIITGPNTGGKTVTLKTIGLLALMNQFGMEIPAGEGSIIAVFDNIFADIGDEQSIEQSLSTFSAHLVNISRIIKNSSGNSFVLLDELGAGTDPEEGVAIAMAVLDHFLKKQALMITTTHHGILKNYGYIRSGVQNAAMEFDPRELTPTFHLIMGIPGESRALEIAKRHGLPPEVIVDSKRYLRDKREGFSSLIENLTSRQRELLEAEREYEVRERELEKKDRESEIREMELRRLDHELRHKEIRELKQFIASGRKELEVLLKDLKIGAAPGVAAPGVAAGEEARSFLDSIKERSEAEENKLSREELALRPEPAHDIRPGMEIIILSTGKRGRVIRRVKNGGCIVETETLRLSLMPHEIRPAKRGYGKGKTLISSEVTAGSPVFELHLRGLRLEEAMKKFERQLDYAIMQGLFEFQVVHGKGEGILQRAIHEYLAKNSFVEDYFFSNPSQGGSGKTIVRLKRAQ